MIAGKVLTVAELIEKLDKIENKDSKLTIHVLNSKTDEMKIGELFFVDDKSKEFKEVILCGSDDLRGW